MTRLPRTAYYEGQAEDKAAVVTVGEEQVEVPHRFFAKDVLMTRDLVPTEPRAQELKFYAPGVGPLPSVHTEGDGGRAPLVDLRPGRPRIAFAWRALTIRSLVTAP